MSDQPDDIIVPEETPEFALPTQVPRATQPRDYEEEPDSDKHHPLLPNSPAGRQMVSRFKTTVVQHLEDRGDKTTDQFLEDLCLDLWRVTRRG